MDGYRTLGRLAVVAVLVGAELWLARDLTSQAAVQGYTATRAVSVAPPRSAPIKTLLVGLGASVRAGDLLAQLDTTEVDDELEAAAAERSYAAAALRAEAARLHRDDVDLAGRFATSGERATAELATGEASARTAAAELAAVDAELARQRELIGAQLTSAAVRDTLQLRRAPLAKQVDAATQVLRVLRDNVAAATRRTAQLDPGGVDELAPLEARLHAADVLVARLTRERDGLTLRAPVDGVIDQLPLHAGDLAAPELPVAVVVAPDARRVIACIPEARAGGVAAGLEIEVTSTYDHDRGRGEIESVTGAIGPLPPRCQAPGSQAVLMGRVAVVTLDAPMGGLPGQSQLVTIHARRRRHDRAATAMPAPRPPADPPPREAVPALLQVPAPLLARSRFEPSGLVWVPALDRYVLVSDDTGTKTRSNHAPWLFTMTADGVVDPEPLVIAGLAQLDDVEAIAAAPDGGLWLLSSQSVSRHGKRPLSRQQLVHVTVAPPAAGGLRADQSIELAELLDRAPAATRAALGVADTRDLDLEAMAVQGGALYLGLKAPVDGRGRATIWRVAAPARLVAGDLAGAGVAGWATTTLTVEADGRPVAAGIADMMFWDADTLVLAATASAIDPAVQAGALYVVRPAAGDLVAHHVRSFPGLKPEGLARAPSGDHLAVVFDRGDDPAMWVELAPDQLAVRAAALSSHGAR